MILFIVSLFSIVNAISCLNEQGDSVDFWVALKGPSGFHYLYYDSHVGVFSESQYTLDDTTHGALLIATSLLDLSWSPIYTA